MRAVLLSLSLSLVGLLTACASSSAACCSAECNAQDVVQSVAKANPEVVRLTVHCTQKDGSMMACASTSADKKGKPSDPEDQKALTSSEPVVIEEAGGFDVTMAILAKDGRSSVACGVTFAKGMSRDDAVAKAKVVAKAVEAGIGSCSCCASK